VSRKKLAKEILDVCFSPILLQAIILLFRSSSMTEKRFAHLHELMKQHQLKTIILNPGPTLAYLTGLDFHLMERPSMLIYTLDEPPLLILPELEQGKLATSRISLRSAAYKDDPSTWVDAYRQALAPLHLDQATIGVEPMRMRYLELNYIQQAVPSAEFTSASPVTSELRLLKEMDEISEMRRAVQIAQRSLLDILPLVKLGVNEKTIAAELTIQLLRNGSDPELPFQPIVAGGPNSANPHLVPTGRPLQSGDLLVIDWGARSNGYCADLTRTFAIGEIDSELKAIYEAVKQANSAGRAASKPGATAGEVDLAARAVIEGAGYGAFFTHRTGHGLGLEDHEPPYIFNGNSLALRPGMTYTVEPGIYLPGRGGVRIEDNLVITHTGCESFSDLSRELMIL
jgi:Xaa-Pro dipeptidase